MMRKIRYAGHVYRLAQEPVAQKPEEKLSEQEIGVVEYSKGLMQKYGLVASEPAVFREGDGIDVAFNVSLPNRVIVKLTFDFNLKGTKSKLQEAVAEMCRVGYVAQDPADIVSLLEAFQTLGSMRPPSTGMQASPKQNRTLVEAVDWLETHGPPVLAALEQRLGAPVDLQDRQALADQLKAQVDPSKGGKPDALGPGAVTKRLIQVLPQYPDDVWASFVQSLENPRGRFTPTKKAVEQKIKQLTRHEQYKGDTMVLGYERDRIVVGLDSPTPFEGIVVVLSKPAGNPNALKLVTAGFVFCGDQVLETGPDETLWAKSLTAVINLVLLSQNAANPKYSPPPSAIQPDAGSPAWSTIQFVAARSKYCFVIQYQNGWRFETAKTRGLPDGSLVDCLTNQQYEALWTQRDNPVQKALKDAGQDRVYVIDVEGNVFQLDRVGEPLDKLLFRIERASGEACT